jgi:hypothetical protein
VCVLTEKVSSLVRLIKEGGKKRTETGVMFNRDGAMPIELVEVEPEGVPANHGTGVDTCQTEDEGHSEIKVVAIHDSL